MAAQPNKAPTADEEDERLERAARVRAMLERWAGENEGTEPTWEIADMTPLRLRDAFPSDVTE